MVKKDFPSGGTKTIEDQIRDLINWVQVVSQEEAQDLVTKMEPETAKELERRLRNLAKSVGNFCR